MIQEWLSHSPEETQEIARGLVRDLPKGSVVGLSGELGSGKTCFAKGAISFLTGLNPHEITSPTFTLMEVYGEDLRIFHVDLFRLEKKEQAEDLPWEELLAKDAITFIEWPEILEAFPFRCHYEIKFSKCGQAERKIRLSPREKK